MSVSNVEISSWVSRAVTFSPLNTDEVKGVNSNGPNVNFTAPGRVTFNNWAAIVPATAIFLDVEFNGLDIGLNSSYVRVFTDQKPISSSTGLFTFAFELRENPDGTGLGGIPSLTPTSMDNPITIDGVNLWYGDYLLGGQVVSGTPIRYVTRFVLHVGDVPGVSDVNVWMSPATLGNNFSYITGFSDLATSVDGQVAQGPAPGDPIISSPLDGATINGGILDIQADDAYAWFIDGNPITNTDLQNFKYFYQDSGTITLRGENGSGGFTELTLTITHSAPFLSETETSWFINNVFAVQQEDLNGLELPVGLYEIRAEIDDLEGGTAVDTHNIEITSSSVNTPGVTEIDAISTGYLVAGADLNTIFAGLSGLTPIADTGIEVNGVDLSQLLAPLSEGSLATLTKYTVAGTDLKSLFAARGSL